jgi:hypothetical protein
VSKSVPTVSMWWDHTTNPSRLIDIMAKIIPRFLNVSLLSVSWQMMSEIILGRPSSAQINILCDVPVIPDHVPKTKYIAFDCPCD